MNSTSKQMKKAQNLQEKCLENNIAKESLSVSNIPIQLNILKCVYSNNEYHVINICDILYAESSGPYCTLHTKTKTYTYITKTLGEITEYFGLTRVHRSFSIQTNNVIKVNMKDSEIFFNDKKSCYYSRRFDVKTILHT